MQLHPPRYRMYTQGEIKPQGWLKRQLRLQADGLAGQLDRIWPDIRDSRWFGGDRDGWERVPYWLDGFIPLAYLLEDEGMIARARACMDAILARQQEDGFLCPCEPKERGRYDMWSFMLLAKVMTVYADLSGDERVLPALEKAMRQFARHIERTPLFNWGAARWFECLIPIFWLYERRPEPWLLALACRLRVQGFDYGKLFEPYLDTVPQKRWDYLTHGVNLAMALKQGALFSRLTGEDPNALADRMLEELMAHHSMAVGHFTCDECVAGDSPVQGAELCSVVEAMYAYEQLLAVSGEPRWGDQLERLAFNALPATCSADMWTHQYEQLTNQIRCAALPREHLVYTTNGPESNMFGLEPFFGCCTANMGQAWPKLCLSAAMGEEGGVALTLLLPLRLDVRIGGVPVSIRVETEYPFRDRAVIRVSTQRPVRFALSLRIPGTASAALVDGQPATPGAFHRVERLWQGDDAVTVELRQDVRFVARPRDMWCVWRGPLLFALPIGEEWIRHEYVRNGVERRFPYCDYEIQPTSAWAYGFAPGEPAVSTAPVDAMPFSTAHPPVTLRVPMQPIAWREEHGVCVPEPDSRAPQGEVVWQTLIPYGSTQLRMTEMPRVQSPE